jgi:UMF1 family MFS transporter
MFNTYVLVAIMVASFFIEPKPEYFVMGLVLYGLGSVVQESAFINYYAMLKSVTTEKNIGRVSGYAWALGYAGGIILLCVSLFGFILPETVFGAPSENGMSVRIVFLFSAAWTLIFSIPMLLNVPEIARKDGGRGRETILQSYQALWGQLKSLRAQAPETFKFLVSSAIYRDGLAGVFTFGAVLGSLAFGFSQTEIILFGIAANIIGSLVGLIIAGSGVFIFAGEGVITYWIGGLLLCLFVGPAQASSRTFVSRFTPHGREGEVFGLYQTTGRAVSFLSGAFWSISIAIGGAVTGAENATIYGVLGLMVILIVGLLLLLRVHPRPQVLESK